jgi:inhibitor of cysteine peptidase
MSTRPFKPIFDFFTISTLLAIPVIGHAGTNFIQQGAPLPAQTLAGFRWQMEMEPAPQASRAVANATEQLTQVGVKTTVMANKLVMDGRESLEQMRTALFDKASPSIEFLGGPVEMTLYLPADGTPVTLNLEARNTTGYRWEVVSGDNSLYAQSAETDFTMRSRGYGTPAIQTLELKAKGKGNTAVHLRYRRPFEPDAPIHTKLSVWMPTVGNIELSDPTPSEPISEVDFRASQSRTGPSPYAELLTKALPSSWDWRTSGIVPPVRNQGSCGSCWSFGTVGVMESAVKKGGGPLTDFSEQFLISCNKDGWSCNGGLTANKYHYNTLGTSQTAIGAVLESAKPYTASNGTCTTSYSHPYKLSGWAFITGSEWTMPTVDQIKNAIYTYGPITAGVCVDSGWYSYTSGIYKPLSNVCNGSTNHQIVLVGWNDATSSWILRNSWGSSWGENGYMRIAWDPTGTTSRVGEGTSWVRYQSTTPTVPTLYRPSGNTYTLTPTYAWSRVGTTASYKLQVYDTVGAIYPINMTVSSSYCSTTTNRCSYTPATSLTNNKSYQWRVAAGSSTFSPWLSFKAFYGFNSQFNGSSTGWVTRPGGPWAVTSAVYYTNGLANKYSSASFNATFNNFTYTAKMKRVDTSGSGWSSGLLVRGLPTSFATDNDWNNAYEFLYTQNGYFSVWKGVGGVWTALKGWTATTAIAPNNWNTLKVIADGNQFRFYINNILVWSGSDGSLTSGQVGIAMYRGATAQQLQVDWATLGMSELYKAAAIVEADQKEIPINHSASFGRERSP